MHYVLPIAQEPTKGYEDVHQLMELKAWNMNVMAELLNKEVCDHVVAVMGNVQLSGEENKPWWKLNNKGKFSLGSAWSMIRQRKRTQLGIMNIWGKGIPLRVSFLL